MAAVSTTEELVILSRAMLAAAAAQEWERVRNIETCRSQLLAAYNAAAELHLGREYVEMILKEMLAINQSVLALALKIRADVAGNLVALTRSAKANQAYRQNE